MWPCLYQRLRCNKELIKKIFDHKCKSYFKSRAEKLIYFPILGLTSMAEAFSQYEVCAWEKHMVRGGKHFLQCHLKANLGHLTKLSHSSSCTRRWGGEKWCDCQGRKLPEDPENPPDRTEGFARKSPHHSTCCRDTWGRRFISPWSWPSYLLPLQQQPSLQGQSRPFLAAVLADSSSFPCPPCTSLTFGLHGPEERGSSSLSRSPMWLQVAHQPLPLPFHLSLLQGTRHNSSSSRFLLRFRAVQLQTVELLLLSTRPSTAA